MFRAILVLQLTASIVFSLPLQLKRLIKPKSIPEFFRSNFPSNDKESLIEGLKVELPTDEKTRLVDFDSPETREFLEENPGAVYLKGSKAIDPSSDGFPVLPNMERFTWKEVLDKSAYESLVRDMRCPVKSFDERRYNELMEELDIYRTQNYWETTRPLLEKKLAACRTEEERNAVEEKFREFNELSFQRVQYYQNLPQRTLEKDFSRYYDRRVKGWEELRHIPPFALMQYAAEETQNRYGVDTQTEDHEEVDTNYYLHDESVAYTAADEGFDAKIPYLPCLNEQESIEEELAADRHTAATKAITETVIQDLSQRSLWYRLIPEQYRHYYDFLLFLRKDPPKGDLTTSLGAAFVLFLVTLMQIQSNRALYYVTLGHLSLLSLMVNRGKPTKKLTQYEKMMERFRPQTTWSANTLRLGALLTGTFAAGTSLIFFLLSAAIPKVSWGIRFRLAYAASLLPTAWWTTKFTIYEHKSQNGMLFRSFQEKIQLAKDRQVSRKQSLDQEALTLKMGQSITDFTEKEQLPLYQEYTYPLDPEAVSYPSQRYRDEVEDDRKRMLGNRYDPRLYHADRFGDEKAQQAATQIEKQLRNTGIEAEQYREGVKRFNEARAKESYRPRITVEMSREEIESALGVPAGFINFDEDFPEWIYEVEAKNQQKRNRVIDRTLSNKFKREMRRLKRLNEPEEKDSGVVQLLDGKPQKVYIGEYGFREERPEWLVKLFGKDPEERLEPVQDIAVKENAAKFGFYRVSHQNKNSDVKLEKNDLKNPSFE